MTADETGSRANRLARFLTRAPLLLSHHLWVWPVVLALVLGGVGSWVRNRVEGVTRAELASRLQTLLNANIAALRLWFSEQELDAKSLANDARTRQRVEELVQLAGLSNSAPAVLANSQAGKDLQLFLNPMLQAQHYIDYVIVGTNRHVLAAPRRFLVGRVAPAGYDLFMEKALAGQLAVSRPFAREATAEQRAEGPTMFVAAPIKSAAGEVIAVLALRMKPEDEFSQLFSVARMGQTGEAYAFDRRGMMLTASRFDADLKGLGLIPNSPEATAILNVRLTDPGFDLEVGKRPVRPAVTPTDSQPFAPVRGERAGRPVKPRKGLPLTRMAAAAIGRQDGIDVQGYRNYWGEQVVGAWAWLPEYEMGVATEVGAREAFQTLYLLREVFWALFALLVLSGGGIFAFTLLVERLQKRLQKSALAARRLGQYVLVQEIGRGANGVVYRARHGLLRRPVAIKLLNPERSDPATAARFDHEAQMTSQLTHPNTVVVFDYGRTPEGLLYYAMEYLGGIDLDQLVRRFGPQPEGRVIHILRQVCGSLAEAHRIGLIHRDIKPANIALTRRGGVCDMVKVLDFGLVKAVHRAGADFPGARTVVGTPHFMAPEAVAKPETVSSRSDLYSLGAVGYWLLTGRTLFDEEEVERILELKVKAEPLPPSARVAGGISRELEQILLQCLARQPESRPASAEALQQALGRCAAAGAWTPAEAELWWQTNQVGTEIVPSVTMPEKTLVIAPRT